MTVRWKAYSEQPITALEFKSTNYLFSGGHEPACDLILWNISKHLTSKSVVIVWPIQYGPYCMGEIYDLTYENTSNLTSLLLTSFLGRFIFSRMEFLPLSFNFVFRLWKSIYENGHMINLIEYLDKRKGYQKCKTKSTEKVDKTFYQFFFKTWKTFHIK